MILRDKGLVVSTGLRTRDERPLSTCFVEKLPEWIFQSYLGVSHPQPHGDRRL
jgi:hypothetical protein